MNGSNTDLDVETSFLPAHLLLLGVAIMAVVGLGVVALLLLDSTILFKRIPSAPNAPLLPFFRKPPPS